RFFARKSAVNRTWRRRFSASIFSPRERAVVRAMTVNPWLWQVKHCFRFSIEPRAAVSKSGSDFTTAALMASLLGTRSSAKAAKPKPAKAQSSTAWVHQETSREFMAAVYLDLSHAGNTESQSKLSKDARPTS